MSTLHRHILGLGFTRWAMLLFIGLFLMHLGEFIGKNGDYVSALGAGRTTELLQYFALRFPAFLAAWLPISAAAAALLTAWPLLRQGTLIALCAAGIPVRRVFASLVGLALGIGALGFILQDQAIPRLELEVSFAQQRMLGKLQLNQTISRTLGWQDGELFWCAQNAVPEEGHYHQVAVFGASGSRHRGVLLMADTLFWQQGQWRLRQAAVVSDYRSAVQLRDECSLAEVGLQLSVDAAALVEKVKQDRNRSSDQLFAVGSENAWGYLMLRICFGLLPVLCLLFALPGFIRMEGRNHLGTQIARALGWMLIPILGYWLLSRILVSNSTYVITGTTVVLGGLIGVGSWRWWTMRV